MSTVNLTPTVDVRRDPVHFLQMWVVPDGNTITPGYEQLEIDHELLAGGLVPVASGMDKHDGESAIRIKPPASTTRRALAQHSSDETPPPCTCRFSTPSSRSLATE